MKHGRFQTIEGIKEIPLHDVIVDVRSTAQRISDWLAHPRNYSRMLFLFAVLCILLPVLLPIIIIALVICSDMHSKAAQYLPMRYPAWSNVPDPGQLHAGTDRPTSAAGIMYFGVIDAKDPYERSKQVFASADDLTRHMLVLGTTGSGKSEFLKGMTFNVLCWASGFFVSDAKADNKLPTDLYSQVRMFARDYDFLAINYLLGGLSPTQIAGMRERLSNGLQPATAADADTLVQMTSNMMVKASGDSKTWQERGLNLFKGITRALCHKRDEGQLTLSMEILREYLSLEKIEDLYVEGWQLANDGQGTWPTPFIGVKSYLEVGLPGFKIDVMLRKRNLLDEPAQEPGAPKSGKPIVQGNETFNQHGYRSDQVYPALSLLIDTYGHIFKRKHPEVDMQDVVVNNRICVSLIPSLEKGSQEQESLGKLNLALLRVMMARALGMSIEGDVTQNVDAKITASAQPFALFLDEFAYQFAEGIALTAAQARSLNFFLCALAQDLEKLTEGERAAEAGAMMANQATKFFMKIIGSDKTHELAAKTLGEAQVAVLGDLEREDNLIGSVKRGRTYRLEKRPRIEREVLENLPAGFATFAYRQRAHVMRTFYPSAEVPRVRYPRINRFLQIPDIAQMTFITSSVELNPSNDKLAIDRIRRTLDCGVAPEYVKPVISDIIQTMITASHEMNPQTPAIERGIVLYTSGVAAIMRAKEGDTMLGRGASGTNTVKTAAPGQVASGLASHSTSIPLTPAIPGQAPPGAPVELVKSRLAAQEQDTRSASEILDTFDPFAEAMSLVPPIVRKPKENVFIAPQEKDDAAAPEERKQGVNDLEADENDFALSGSEILDEGETPLVTDEIEAPDAVGPDAQDYGVTTPSDPKDTIAEVEQKITAAVHAMRNPVQIKSDLQRLSKAIVDPSIVAKLGDEVVGLRETSLEGLAKLESAFGASHKEAQESAHNTEQVVAQSLTVIEGNKISATSTDIELMFGELVDVIGKV